MTSLHAQHDYPYVAPDAPWAEPESRRTTPSSTSEPRSGLAASQRSCLPTCACHRSNTSRLGLGLGVGVGVGVGAGAGLGLG